MSCGGVQPWYNNYKILGKFFMYWKYTKMSKKILNNSDINIVYKNKNGKIVASYF